MPTEKLIHNPGGMELLLPIIYNDGQLVAINKPNRLLVHKTRIAEEQHLFANRLLASQLGREVFPVHRIDRATSGVLLFAFTAEVTAATQRLFGNGNIRKDYLAVVRGFTREADTINEPLIRHETGAEQAATTMYRRIATIDVPIAVNKYPTSRYSLVSMQPKTGRTHQLRRHFNHMGHPIVGDTKYGDLRHNRMFLREFGTSALLLHARRLAFTHPFSGEEICIEAPVAPDFQTVLTAFGWTLAD